MTLRLFAFVLFCAVVGLPQNQPKPIPVGSVTLTLAADEDSLKSAPEPTNCLKKYPGIACIPIRVTFTNVGTDPILWQAQTCGVRAQIEHRGPETSWTPLQIGLFTCVSNATYIEILWPGQSYSTPAAMGLADFGFDIAKFTQPDRIPPTSNSYEQLAAKGEHHLRALWTVRGCIASKHFKARIARGGLDPFKWTSYCALGKSQDPGSFTLRSNELALTQP